MLDTVTCDPADMPKGGAVHGPIEHIPSKLPPATVAFIKENKRRFANNGKVLKEEAEALRPQREREANEALVLNEQPYFYRRLFY